MNPTIKCLIVEDDKSLAQVLARRLQDYGCDTVLAYDGRSALALFNHHRFHVALIDIGLPDMNGFTLVKSIQALRPELPTIVMTSSLQDQNELAAFQNGAHLFHAKPINFQLLDAQIKSLLRLSGFIEAVSVGDLTLYPATRMLQIRDFSLLLSPKEYQLMFLLMRNPGRVYSREEIMRATNKRAQDSLESSVDTLISRMRVKLSTNEVIETVHGVGFRVHRKYIPKA